MSYAYHGNYCGPGWTGGEYNSASEGNYNIEPIDEFDSSCKNHDLSYRNGDYLIADRQFVSENKGKGLKRDLASKLVYLQLKLREYGIMPKTKNVAKKIKSLKREVKATKRVVKANPKRMGRQSTNKSKMVGLSYRQTKTPVRKTKMSHMTRDGITITGSEQVANINVVTTNQIGDVLVNFPLSPQSFTNQKLAVHASLWEFYKFEGAEIIYQPIDNSTASANIIATLDYDATDTYSSGTSNVNRLLENTTYFETQTWQKQSMRLKPNLKAQQLFYTSAKTDQTRTIQARLIVIANSTFSSNRTIGNIIVRYKIRFYGSQLDAAGGNFVPAFSYSRDSAPNGTGRYQWTAAGTAGVITLAPKMYGNYNCNPSISAMTSTTYALNLTLPNPGTYLVQFVTSIDVGSITLSNASYSKCATGFNVTRDREVITTSGQTLVGYAFITITQSSTNGGSWNNAFIQYIINLSSMILVNNAVLFGAIAIKLSGTDLTTFTNGAPLPYSATVPTLSIQQEATDKLEAKAAKLEAKLEEVTEIMRRLGVTHDIKRKPRSLVEKLPSRSSSTADSEEEILN